MSDLTDRDGTRLLYADEIAELAGLKLTTINYYNAFRRRERKHGERTPAKFLPPPVRRVKRVLTRGDGKPVTIWVPLWREDQIRAWLEYREQGRAVS